MEYIFKFCANRVDIVESVLIGQCSKFLNVKKLLLQGFVVEKLIHPSFINIFEKICDKYPSIVTFQYGQGETRTLTTHDQASQVEIVLSDEKKDADDQDCQVENNSNVPNESTTLLKRYGSGAENVKLDGSIDVTDVIIRKDCFELLPFVCRHVRIHHQHIDAKFWVYKMTKNIDHLSKDTFETVLQENEHVCEFLQRTNDAIIRLLFQKAMRMQDIEFVQKIGLFGNENMFDVETVSIAIHDWSLDLNAFMLWLKNHLSKDRFCAIINRIFDLSSQLYSDQDKEKIEDIILSNAYFTELIAIEMNKLVPHFLKLIECGHDTIVCLMIQYSKVYAIDVNVVDKTSGDSALMIAIKHNRDRIIDELLYHDDIDVTYINPKIDVDDNNTALILASRQKMHKVAQTIRDKIRVLETKGSRFTTKSNDESKLSKFGKIFNKKRNKTKKNHEKNRIHITAVETIADSSTSPPRLRSRRYGIHNSHMSNSLSSMTRNNTVIRYGDSITMSNSNNSNAYTSHIVSGSNVSEFTFNIDEIKEMENQAFETEIARALKKPKDVGYLLSVAYKWNFPVAFCLILANFERDFGTKYDVVQIRDETDVESPCILYSILKDRASKLSEYNNKNFSQIVNNTRFTSSVNDALVWITVFFRHFDANLNNIPKFEVIMPNLSDRYSLTFLCYIIVVLKNSFIYQMVLYVLLRLFGYYEIIKYFGSIDVCSELLEYYSTYQQKLAVTKETKTSLYNSKTNYQLSQAFIIIDYFMRITPRFLTDYLWSSKQFYTQLHKLPKTTYTEHRYSSNRHKNDENDSRLSTPKRVKFKLFGRNNSKLLSRENLNTITRAKTNKLDSVDRLADCVMNSWYYTSENKSNNNSFAIQEGIVDLSFMNQSNDGLKFKTALRKMVKKEFINEQFNNGLENDILFLYSTINVEKLKQWYFDKIILNNLTNGTFTFALQITNSIWLRIDQIHLFHSLLKNVANCDLFIKIFDTKFLANWLNKILLTRDRHGQIPVQYMVLYEYNLMYSQLLYDKENLIMDAARKNNLIHILRQIQRNSLRSKLSRFISR